MDPLALTRNGGLDAGQPHQQRLRKVADQFEAVFVQQLLKQSDDPFGHGELGGIEASSAERQFRSLYHNGLAEHTAGGVGIGDMVYRWLLDHGGDTSKIPEVPHEF